MRFQFDYQVDMTPELAATLNDQCAISPRVSPEDKSYKYATYQGDIANISRYCPGLHIRVETGEVGGTAFQEIVRRLERIELAVQSGGGSAQNFNARVNVHVPNLGLLLIDEVEVLTSECTHSLHDYLRDGWRILAICPQPDRRRPDYVIGRTPQSRKELGDG